MVDLTAEMAQLWASLGPFVAAAAPGQGKVLQFVAARAGEGTSTVAREFALYASTRTKKPVWLVDLDFLGAAQHAAITRQPVRFGALGQPAAASPDGSTFFAVQPPTRAPDGRPWPDAGYLVAHPVGGPKLWVTRFRAERLRPDQAPQVIAGPAYWQALRRHAQLIVVDAPAAEQSDAAATLAPFVDASVLVVSADADAGGPAALKASIVEAGGRCAGIFVNRVSVEPPAFLKAVLR